MEKVFLNPGEVFFSHKETIVETILGSCVAVCIYDGDLKTGGITHYLLPVPVLNKQEDNKNNYAINSIPELLKKFKDAGSNRKNLCAKIIGGSLISDSVKADSMNVGVVNIEKAHELLKKYCIKIVAENVGGTLGRKVHFNTSNGDLKFKFIEKAEKHEEVETTSPLKKQKSSTSVMIIDDSKPIRIILKKIIEFNPNFKVVAEAENPIEAAEIRKKIKPDVMTLDINMPKMDGVTYLKKYMFDDPVPTIIVTDYNLDDSSPVFEALDNGAFDYIKKPSLSEMETMNEDIFNKLSAAANSNIKQTIKRIRKIKTDFVPEKNIPDHVINSHLIVVGASTGGTEALKDFFADLPKTMPPIFVVQHMPPVFTKAFAERLDNLSKIKVKEATDDELAENNTAYIAPGGKQMKLFSSSAGKIKIKITDDDPVNRFKPSVDYLFQSVTEIKTKKVIGVLLTGMGADGAIGLLSLKKNGADTIAQDETTSVVFGMPKVAIDMGAASYVEKLEDIAGKVISILCKRI